MVYRKSVLEGWHCSFCGFTHDDPDVVIDHENREHGGKKRNETD